MRFYWVDSGLLGYKGCKQENRGLKSQRVNWGLNRLSFNLLPVLRKRVGVDRLQSVRFLILGHLLPEVGCRC